MRQQLPHIRRGDVAPRRNKALALLGQPIIVELPELGVTNLHVQTMRHDQHRQRRVGTVELARPTAASSGLDLHFLRGCLRGCELRQRHGEHALVEGRSDLVGVDLVYLD